MSLGKRARGAADVVRTLPVMDRARQDEVEQLVRQHAATPARAFAALRDSGDVPLDVVADGALHHPAPVIRRLAVDLLDHLGDDATTPVLVAALRDPVPRVRRHAVHALVCRRCRPAVSDADGLRPYLRVLAGTDPNAKVRAAARSALGALDEPSQAA